MDKPPTKDEAVAAFWKVIARAHADACLRQAATSQEAPQPGGLSQSLYVGITSILARVPFTAPGVTKIFSISFDRASR